MFVKSLVRINIVKTREADVLHERQLLLEAEIHRKELSQTKVQFQFQKLEDEYRQLDMFSHIISHNLRGPISRVSGILELLKMHPYTSEEQKNLMGHLKTSALLIDEVIKDLNYILVQKRLGQETCVNISLKEILREVKQHLFEDIKSSKALIKDDLYQADIYCIKGIMISIFYNLISNSIKYAARNAKPVITISAIKSGDYLNLRFSDAGIGFDADQYRDKVFRLYNRFHNHVSGKGMGLFLVKSHVDMLNGTINVESEPGKGTTFTINLPLKENNFLSNVFNNKKLKTEDIIS
jgi:signal transduction histidine kinase